MTTATTAIVKVDGAGEQYEAVAVEAGGPAHPILAALDAAGRGTGIPSRTGQVASDNREYAAAGLADVGIGAGVHGYHTEHDTAEYAQSEILSTTARLVVATVAEMATTGGSPNAWNVWNVWNETENAR